MALNKWEGIDRQSIYDDFRVDSKDVSDDYLITLFGNYSNDLYPIMKKIQRFVIQQGYFIGTVADYHTLDVEEQDGSKRNENLDEKCVRYLEASDLAIFVLLLDKVKQKPSEGTIIEMMEVLRKKWILKCVFLVEGNIEDHFSTLLIRGHPEYQRMIKFDNIESNDVKGITEIIISRCEQLYHKDFEI